MRKAAPSSDESRLAVLFRSTAAAIEAGRYHAAVRIADSARRFAPANATAILLHSRLLLKTGAARAAVELVRAREEPESRALHAEAACEVGLLDAARQSCESLLSSFAVDGVEHLPETASRLCRADLDRFPGWIGADSSLRLTGALRANRAATLELDGRRLERIEAAGAQGSLVAFSAELSQGCTGILRAHVDEVELLGSGFCWPPDCRTRGWVVWEDEVLSGEVSLDWLPRSAVQIVVCSPSGQHLFEAEPVRRGAIGWCFAIPFQQLAADDAVIHVAALLPGGRRIPLAGSPVRALQRAFTPSRELRIRCRSAAGGRMATASRGVNVVVPVYRGLRETLACLHSVLATTHSRNTILTVVDDASPEPPLRAALAELAGAGRICLVRNPQNLGFPGAANRGMQLYPDRDVVLLNSDTEVFSGWLERLRTIAYSEEDVGTVTPLGEASSITTYSDRTQRACSAAQAAAIDRIAHTVNGDRSIEIPVGVGFCLYIRRSCLDDTGELDEEAFGKGYGEETDFCLRARSFGWRHLAAAGVFVRHTGGHSYGPAREVLTTRNARVINYRHPGYDDLIAKFIATDPLLEARRAIDQRRLLERAVRPVLLVSFDLAGGVERHVNHRQATLQANHTILVLQACGSPGEPDRVRVVGADFAHLAYDLRADLPELRRLLLELGLEHLELHHFLGLPDELLEMVVRLGVPYRVYIHDYAWVCPRVSLLNGAGTYCGEPAIEACEACVREHGSAFSEPITVSALRARSARILGGAERVIAPTRDVRERLARYFPGLPVEVTPWEAPCSIVRRPPRARHERRRIRVALIGAIGTPKGYSVLLACARDAANRDLPLEFVVIGYTRDDSTLLESGRVFVTGPYEESEATALLEREQCDIALFPCQAPETWCYTLTYALARNLPIVAFDLGAVAERLRTAGVGTLLPLSTAPTAVNDALLGELKINSPATPPSRTPDRRMQPNYSSVGEQTPLELTAAVQVIALPVGIYAFTVTAGGAPAPDAIALPSLLIAPAPVRSAGTIEFLEGPDTFGRWLTRAGDVVMVKISQQSATLLLTSLRAPDSSVLSIDIRKLDVSETPPTPTAGNGESIDGLHAESAVTPRALTMVHVRSLGDLEFTQGWAGSDVEDLWIEAFSVIAQEPAAAELLEYSAVDSEGTETGWVSGGAVCGTRGQEIPLTAFAVRVSETAGEDYSCSYSGRFLSGAIVGPFRNGSLCCSQSPDDPLVAIEVQLDRNVPDPGYSAR